MLRVHFNSPQEFLQEGIWQSAMFIDCNSIEVFESRMIFRNTLKCITSENDFSLFFLRDIKRFELCLM